MVGHMKLTYEEAKSAFALDESGDLVWNCKKPGVRPGMPAGFAFNGGRYVTFNWKRVVAKRVVWLLTTGTWPTKRLYHLDGDAQNCRFSNLTTQKVKSTSGPLLVLDRLPGGEVRAVSNGRVVAVSADRAKVLAVVANLLLN